MCGSDAAASHLTYAFCCLDNGDLMTCDTSAADAQNIAFITRWNRIKENSSAGSTTTSGMYRDM